MKAWPMLQNEFASAVLLMALIASTLLPTNAPCDAYGQEDMTPTQTFETQERYAGIALSADGRYITAMSSETHQLPLFNRTHMLWSASVPGIYSIAMSGDASAIVAGANTGLYIFTIQDSTPQMHCDLRFEKPLVAVSDDGNTVACAATSKDQSGKPATALHMFERSSQSPIWSTTFEGALESVSISSNGSYTAISTNNPGTLHLFSKQNSTPLWTCNLGEQGGVARISRDGNYIIATGGNATVEHGLRVYRFHRESPLPNYIKVISELPSDTGLQVASQGTIFTLSLAESNRLIFFNLDLPPYGYGPGSVLNVSLPGQPIAVSMSAEGRLTAVGTGRGVYIYEYADKQLVLMKQYAVDRLVILDVVMTADGKRLAAIAAEQQNRTQSTICVFEIQDNNPSLWLQVIAAIIVIVVGLTTLAYFRCRKQKLMGARFANT